MSKISCYGLGQFFFLNLKENAKDLRIFQKTKAVTRNTLAVAEITMLKGAGGDFFGNFFHKVNKNIL